jgi:hypothetical protein
MIPRSILITLLGLVGLLFPQIVHCSESNDTDSDDSGEVAVLRQEYDRLFEECIRIEGSITDALVPGASLESLARLHIVLEQAESDLAELASKLEAMSRAAQQCEIQNVWLTDEVDGSDELKSIPVGETAFLYVSYLQPNLFESLRVELTVTDVSSGKEIAAIDRDRARKGDSLGQYTGISVAEDLFVEGQLYLFTAVLTAPEGESLESSIRFSCGDLVEPLGEIELTGTYEDGSELKEFVSLGSGLVFDAVVPLINTGEGTLSWKLVGSNGEIVEGSETVETIGEDGGDKPSRYAFRSSELPKGHYEVVIAHELLGGDVRNSEAGYAFELVDPFELRSLTVGNSKEKSQVNGKLKVGDSPYLYAYYIAVEPVRSGFITVSNQATGEEYYSASITEQIKVEGVERRTGILLEPEMLPYDTDIQFAARFVDSRGEEVVSQRVFSINTLQPKEEANPLAVTTSEVYCGIDVSDGTWDVLINKYRVKLTKKSPSAGCSEVYSVRFNNECLKRYERIPAVGGGFIDTAWYKNGRMSYEKIVRQNDTMESYIVYASNGQMTHSRQSPSGDTADGTVIKNWREDGTLAREEILDRYAEAKMVKRYDLSGSLIKHLVRNANGNLQHARDANRNLRQTN